MSLEQLNLFKDWSKHSVLMCRHREPRAKRCRDGSKFIMYGEPKGSRMDAGFVLGILHFCLKLGIERIECQY